jgi:hypothetical protein
MTFRGVAPIASCLAVLKANCKYIKSSSMVLCRLQCYVISAEQIIVKIFHLGWLVVIWYGDIVFITSTRTNFLKFL